MSSRTPEECIEIAVDKSAKKENRNDAIHALKRANECDELKKLVHMENIEDHYRHEALHALATPQCDTTLKTLIEEGALNRSLREEAKDLFEEIDNA